MSRWMLFLLPLTFAVASIHTYIDDSLKFKVVDWFLFYDHKQQVQLYIHKTGQFVNYIIMVHIIYMYAKRFNDDLIEDFVLIYLGLCYWDLFDYWLCGGQTPLFYQIFTGAMILFVFRLTKYINMRFKWNG